MDQEFLWKGTKHNNGSYFTGTTEFSINNGKDIIKGDFKYKYHKN